MGRPKLLLPWGATSVLGHLRRQWQALGPEQFAVVCAADDSAVKRELDRLGVPDLERIDNPAPERGMFSSIQCAASWAGWNSTLTHWGIALGDQPHLRLQTLRGLIDFASAHSRDICQPGYQGRPRHPVIVPRREFAELARSDAPDLKSFLASRPSAVYEVDDPGLDLDLDQPEDYERALRLADCG